MSLLSSYIVPCLTEAVDIVTDYMVSPPTVCPHNNTHTINEAGIILFSTISSKTVTVNQHDPAKNNGGYYRCDYFHFNIPGATGISTYDVSFPYDIEIYSVILQPTTANVGDNFDVVAYPSTPGGIITVALAPSDTSLTLNNVSPFYAGFHAYVTNGVTTDDLGDITSVDIPNNIINFKTPCVNSYSIGSVMLFEVDRIRNGKIMNDQNISLGFSKIGSSGLKAGKILRIVYDNVSGTAKTITILIELNY